MSHGLLGRGSCLETIWILLVQFDQRYDSTRRDRAGRWLWRLVRPFCPIHHEKMEARNPHPRLPIVGSIVVTLNHRQHTRLIFALEERRSRQFGARVPAWSRGPKLSKRSMRFRSPPSRSRRFFHAYHFHVPHKLADAALVAEL
jgi:hypothetical protein